MSVTKVRVTTEQYPTAKSTWEVDLGESTALLPEEDKIKFTLLYNNLTYDLIAAAVGKLGWEYSKLLTGESSDDQFNTVISKVMEALETYPR